MTPARITTANPLRQPYPVAEWVSRYEAGANVVRIAAGSDVAPSTVVKALHLAGIPMRGAKPRWRTGR